MNLKCLMDKHEPEGKNLLAFAFGEDCEGTWLRKCKYCDKYIGQSDGRWTIINEADAKRVIATMHTVVLADVILAAKVAELRVEQEAGE